MKYLHNPLKYYFFFKYKSFQFSKINTILKHMEDHLCHEILLKMCIIMVVNTPQKTEFKI